MATITASSLSASAMTTGLRVNALSTGILFESKGVMTMKMISTTSITSTMGVTLISETGGGAFFNSISHSPGSARGGDGPRPRASESTRWTLFRYLRTPSAGAGLGPLQEVVDEF